MKSVVVEIRGKFAAVLSDDGSITKVRNRNYAVGQEILPEKAACHSKAGNESGLLLKEKEKGMIMKKLHITKKLAVCAACVAFLLLCSGTGIWAYASPYSYVSLDVNPSIYYTLNRFDQVINVKAVNDDGKIILEKIKISGLKHKSIEKAILTTVERISKEGYFTRNNTPAVTDSAVEKPNSTNTGAKVVTGSAISIDGGIVITVSSGNAKLSHGLVKDIRKTVKAFVKENKENVEVEVSSVGLERVKEARELGVTPGKLNLVEKLKQSAADPNSIKVEEWLNKPVKDIMKEIKKNRKAADSIARAASGSTEEQTNGEDKSSAANDSSEMKDSEKSNNGKGSKEKGKKEKSNKGKSNKGKSNKGRYKKEKANKEQSDKYKYNKEKANYDNDDNENEQSDKDEMKNQKASQKSDEKALKKKSKEADKAKKEKEKQEKMEEKDQNQNDKDEDEGKSHSKEENKQEESDKSNENSSGRSKNGESDKGNSGKNSQSSGYAKTEDSGNR
ncbi:hypothetical protein SAMN02745136_04805 [Anaerocolumna jejuensis DSM 15929]|uniref:RsgI N-terminal anti-sigma domain-containing protein n=1 Tax=Anaerocolumna jejuensis DSM 15929 TaxID=1121322 RepID=A0A1M7ABZ2_9FIRM|nr:anti-sigma factor domain-containing protein [Anaerocolumna jejuensis]SHL40188.1 hypothetical protein SAMN02745136_04805 [Anaerocolumna jejuensis DSM 15929]